MATDAMDIDSNPVSAGQAESEKERKRKHKHKDESASSPSKKKRKHEKGDKDKESKKKDKSKSGSKEKSKSKSKSKSGATTSTSTTPDSPYSLTTATLYLPLSPISISPTHALASLLAEHLSPLLLTYYPPLQGIVLAYSNASISSNPPSSSSRSTSQNPSPQPLTLAATAGEYGVMYVYLTATFLVFRPQRGQTLDGWVNVQSEGFLGAVVLNLFSVGIERKRLPTNWKWVPPGEEDEYGESGNGTTANSTEDEDDTENKKDNFDPEKELFNPVTLASDSNPFNPNSDQIDPEDQDQEQTKNQDPSAEDETDSYEGHFTSVSGHRVRGTIKFRVVDIDVIPGTERERGFLSIEGTMLSEEEEKKVVEDERNGVVASAATPGLRRFTVPIMSGGVDVEPAVKDVQLDHEVESPTKKMSKSKK